MIKQIKAHLNNSIQSIIGQKVEFVKQDEQAFTRKRSLSLETMIRTILGMGGKSLSKELLDAKLTVSNSAFVQRRYQIKPEAFYALFKEFTAPIPLNTDFPIFAADGSDICIPRNPIAAYACRLFFNCSLSSLQLKNYLKKQLSIIRPNRKYPRKIKAQSVVDFIYRVT